MKLIPACRSRAENLSKAASLESQGRLKDARDCYTKCIDITPEMAYQLIKVGNPPSCVDRAHVSQALRAEGVEYVVAPYEADAQLCFLEREGYVDGIITEDSDLLVFGCKQVRPPFDGGFELIEPLGHLQAGRQRTMYLDSQGQACDSAGLSDARIDRRAIQAYGCAYG